MGQKTAQRGPRTRRAHQKAATTPVGRTASSGLNGASKPRAAARTVVPVRSDIAPVPVTASPSSRTTPPAPSEASSTLQPRPAEGAAAGGQPDSSHPVTGDRASGSLFTIRHVSADQLAPATSSGTGDGSRGSKAAVAERPAQTPTASPPSGAWERSWQISPPTSPSQWAAESLRAAWRWVRGLSGESWLWIGILVLATVLRFWGLGDKPLHHDESMHAFFSLSYATDPTSYEYDPLLHGPFQFHAEGIIFAILIGLANLFHVASAAGNPWINDATARILPATTGVGLVAITYGLRRELGRVVAPIAAFLLAVSPSFVYFSRFLREDIYFACFTYLTVMCAVQFARTRSARWLVATAIAFILAYATKESIFLNMAIWGAFLAVLLVWELGHAVADRLPRVFSDRERAFFGHAAPLLLFGAVSAPVALWGLHQLNQLSLYITAHTTQTDAQVLQLENATVVALLYASIALAVVVIVVLVRQILFDTTGPELTGMAASPVHGALTDAEISDLDGSHMRPAGTGGWLADLRGHIDPQRQPFLSLLLGTSWVPWFVAFVAGWVLFAALFWVVPGHEGILNIAQGFQVGVGRGIWQGLYYWLQQQQVARGGQPWYYYLLLIPLYEQLAVVFGIAGLVRALARPTRFRLFLVWWFVGTLVLYSWAGEKMPWLSIHILLPLMLLAALALEWPIREAWALVQRLAAGEQRIAGPALVRPAGAVLSLTAGLVLLVPMLHGMLVLSHQDAANGPHEMMVYVQTTPDVQRVMNRINQADALMYGGRHQLTIAVGVGEEWPFYWYLRDYWLTPHPGTYAVFDPSATDPSLTQKDVLILTESDAATFLAAHPTGYRSHTYQLRSWWDEGYKPPQSGGVGLGPWLSYGPTAAPNAKFNFGRAATRLWSWLWSRTPLGYDNGSYNFVLVVRDGVPIQP